MFSVLIWFGEKVYFTLASSPNLGQSKEKNWNFRSAAKKNATHQTENGATKKKSMPCVWANCHMICYNFKGIRIFASCLHASMSSRGGDHNFGRKKVTRRIQRECMRKTNKYVSDFMQNTPIFFKQTFLTRLKSRSIVHPFPYVCLAHLLWLVHRTEVRS